MPSPQSPLLRITKPVARQLRAADPASECVNELLYGEACTLLAGEDDAAQQPFVPVRALRDGYEGYVARDALADITPDSPASDTLEATTHVIAMPASSLYTAPDVKAPRGAWLPMGAELVARKIERKWIETDAGFVPRHHVMAVGEAVGDPLDAAYGFIGAPYAWGGKSIIGIDCSGLVQIACARVGVDVPRDSGPQLAAFTLLADDVTPAPGDIVGFEGHIGFMIDEDQVLHANATRMAVTIDAFSDVLDWVHQDLGRNGFKGFYRIPG